MSGLQILKSRTFEGRDGHLYTTSDLLVNGRVLRGVTAPGGRLGDRWEWVESIPVAPAGDEEGHDAHAASASPDGGYALQSGSAAGTTVSADASPTGSGLGPAGYATLYGFGWCARDLGAPYRVNTARAPFGAVTAIRNGFNVWAKHPNSWMSFWYRGGTSKAKSSNDGTNVVWFSYDPGAFLGRTWVYGQGSRITGFDMQLNTRYSLSIGGSGYDLQSLVAHEAGHAAGFGHTSSAGNLMYGGGQPPRGIDRTLGPQDAAGLSFLYPYNKVSGKVVSVTAPKSLRPGATGTVTTVLQNTGRTPWGGKYGPARIRTTSPYGRKSPFAVTSWVGGEFPSRSFATTCKGQRVTLSWKMRAPVDAEDLQRDLRAGGRRPGPHEGTHPAEHTDHGQRVVLGERFRERQRLRVRVRVGQRLRRGRRPRVLPLHLLVAPGSSGTLRPYAIEACGRSHV